MSKFILVMSVNPHRDGGFSRAGLRFSREWRALELSGKNDLDRPIPVIDTATFDRIKAETFLAWKPATEAELTALERARAEAPGDKDAQIASLAQKNADLEARLMKLELAAQGGGKGAKGEQPAKG